MTKFCLTTVNRILFIIFGNFEKIIRIEKKKNLITIDRCKARLRAKLDHRSTRALSRKINYLYFLLLLFCQR